MNRHAKLRASRAAATAAAAGALATVAGAVLGSSGAQALVYPPDGAHQPAGGLAATPLPHMAQDVAAAAATYTVRPGDSLSAIASAHGLSWRGLWGANASKIKDPDLIVPGQVLVLAEGQITLSMRRELDSLMAPPARQVVTAAAAVSSSVPSAPSQPAQQVTVPGGGGLLGFQACVIARESGGNPQVMNSTGHYGLYQFSESTWDDNGGNPADFGHASVAEQNAVFWTAVEKPGGEGNWAPYDGC